MATALKKDIQLTPMAPYIGLMRDMDVTDKQAVVAFLIDTMASPSDRELFEEYLRDWQRDTRFLSSVTAITSHPAFNGIVNMGGNAVPFIVEEIERHPSNLVWALNAIFHKKIGDGLTVTEACKLWTAELKRY
jgi:hypothetical protein